MLFSRCREVAFVDSPSGRGWTAASEGSWVKKRGTPKDANSNFKTRKSVTNSKRTCRLYPQSQSKCREMTGVQPPQNIADTQYDSLHPTAVTRSKICNTAPAHVVRTHTCIGLRA